MGHCRYTSKLLMATIDEQHRGTYDFIYLPIDFKVSSILNMYYIITKRDILDFNLAVTHFIIIFVTEQVQYGICIHQHDRHSSNFTVL